MRSLVRWRGVAAATAAATAMALGFVAPPVMADSEIAPIGPGVPISESGVTPTEWSGNPDCEDVGFNFGFEVKDNYNGTFNMPANASNPTGPPYHKVTVSSADNKYLDWSSTRHIDAVIVKGGNGANAYVYVPAADEDTGLASPTNGSTEPAGLSHVWFCYDAPEDINLPLSTVKTANGTSERGTTWDIDKTVSPESVEGFAGDSFDVDWTVTVTKGLSDTLDNVMVQGTITISNVNGIPVNVSVADSIGTFGADVNCPSTDPGGDETGTVPAGSVATPGTLTCGYVVDLGDGWDPDDLPTKNTATVTSLTEGVDSGEPAEADIDWADPVVTGDESVDLSDERTGSNLPASTDSSGSWTYPETLECPTDLGEYEDEAWSDTESNKAILDGDTAHDEATASVDIDCYALHVTKDAFTSLDRDWTWNIFKDGDKTSLVLNEDTQSFVVNYTVKVSATSVDSNWKVFSGEDGIKVHNGSPIDATINDVTDLVSPGDVAADVFDCVVVEEGVADVPVASFPFELEGGTTLVCAYEAEETDGLEGTETTNTATATLQNYVYEYDSEGVASGTASDETDFSGSADVDYTKAAIAETDECIDVTDSKYGALGEVCADDLNASGEYTFASYPLTVGPYEECGEYQFTNVASFLTNDTDTPGNNDHVVNVVVPCPGCTLTQGYWKTHSEFGPAPTDDGWYLLGDADGDTFSEGPNESFFASGKTWYQVFWTAPAGNAYFNLAHQYMAAKLNVVNGAYAPPAVVTALSSAVTLLTGKGPGYVVPKSQKGTWITIAATLGSYNEGLIGPGHCSE